MNRLIPGGSWAAAEAGTRATRRQVATRVAAVAPARRTRGNGDPSCPNALRDGIGASRLLGGLPGRYRRDLGSEGYGRPREASNSPTGGRDWADWGCSQATSA